MQRTREPEDPFFDLMFNRMRDELATPSSSATSTKPVYRAMLNYHAPGAALVLLRRHRLWHARLGAAGGNRRQAGTARSRRWSPCLATAALQFSLAELIAAREAEAGIAIIVWNNNGYREIKDYMVSKEIKPIAVDVAAPDFLGVAKAMGVDAIRANSLDEMIAALKAHGRSATMPLLIETGPWMIET